MSETFDPKKHAPCCDCKGQHHYPHCRDNCTEICRHENIRQKIVLGKEPIWICRDCQEEIER